MPSWDYLYTEYCELLKQRCETFDVSHMFTELPIEKKVCFVHEILKNENFLPASLDEPMKNSREAIEFRKLGNQSFCRKRDTEAIRYYTRSVTLSPMNSEELALAYANRSAVLFRVKRYSSCISDIARAFKNNYPDSLKQKLLNRRKECFEKIQVMDNKKYLISKLNLHDQLSSANDVQSPEIFHLPKTDFKNELIPNASEKIKIGSSSEMGRHLFASDNIPPGEILAIEKPYASILLPQYYLTHCSNCFVRTEASIPCENCPHVVFCSNSCYEDAMNNFHKSECRILPYLISLEFGKMELLALRILIIATKQGNSLNSLFNNPFYKQPLCTKRSTFVNTSYSSDNYYVVHNLEDNLNHRTIPNLFRRIVATVFIIHGLRCASFFAEICGVETPECKLNSVESYTGALLLKYLLIVASNAHEISEFLELENESEGFTKTESLEIGAALYPLLSLTNHSCDPNVVRQSYNNNVVLRSIQPIAKGEQIFDNYGYHFAVHPRLQRQTHLRDQYYFDCCCDPCKFSWPTFPELPDPGFTEKLKTINSKKIEEGSLLCKKFFAMPPRTANEEDLNNLLEYLSFLHYNVQRPCKSYSGCQEVIKQIMAYRANYYALHES